MLKKIIFCLVIPALIFIICGCAPQVMILGQPEGPRVIFVRSDEPIIVPGDSLLTPTAREILAKPFAEFRPDPCKGIIKNYSSQIIVWVWLNGIY